MTQPKFAPILLEDEVRELYKLAAPKPWTTSRPADFRPGPLGFHRGRGIAGPDQGYALLLAERLAPRLVLGADEHPDDVLAGACVIAMRRAALFGRAPVLFDLELALRLFSFFESAPESLAEARRGLFSGVAHDYWRGRELADFLPETTLKLSQAAFDERLSKGPDEALSLAGLDAPERTRN